MNKKFDAIKDKFIKDAKEHDVSVILVCCDKKHTLRLNSLRRKDDGFLLVDALLSMPLVMDVFKLFIEDYLEKLIETKGGIKKPKSNSKIKLIKE